MTKKLTTHNAEITTATVEVKTLTISGKQVTQSVFRQLREVKLIAEDGTLNGVPWGYVNYHPDKCADSREHLHVVWQLGADLLRSRVDRLPDFARQRSPEFWPAVAQDFVTSHVRDFFAGNAKFWDGQLPPRTQDDLVRIEWGDGVVSFPVFTCVDRVADAAIRARKELNRWPGPSDSNWYQEAQANARAAWDAALKALNDHCDGLNATTAELLEACRSAAVAEAERRQRQLDVRAALQELPHLFIAV